MAAEIQWLAEIQRLKAENDELRHNGLPHAVKCNLQASASRETFRRVLDELDTEERTERSFGDPEKDTVYCLALSNVRSRIDELMVEMGVSVTRLTRAA